MGELALPLYMTNFMAVAFVNNQFETYGLPTESGHCMAAQFIFMHVLAWMFYKFCANTHASIPASKPPGANPVLIGAPKFPEPP
mmetsp:Transcript_133954/g.232774  ORF Transcript_133954/g.232774 Transcript_133954/m.232774 type:complete len:84 (+) Transcript_133954:2-253(+)